MKDIVKQKGVLPIIVVLITTSLLLSGCRLANQAAETPPDPAPTEEIEAEDAAADESETNAEENVGEETTETDTETASIPTDEPEIELAEEPDAQAGSWMTISDQFIFFDNFQNGSADRWLVSEGWIVQQHGKYYTFDTTQKGLSLIKGGGGWENYMLRGQVLLHEGTVAFSIYVSQAGRYLMVYNAEGLYIIKEDFITGELTPLAKTDPPELNRWHWLGIAVMNGQIQAGFDSELLIDITDPYPLTRGTAGIGAADESFVRVDNITITQLDAPLLTPGELAQVEAFELPEEITNISDVPVIDLIETEPENDTESEAEDEEVEEEKTPTSGADLSVKSVAIPKPWAAGEPLEITINIQNLGPDPAGAFTLIWFPLADGVVGKSWDINGLGAGELLTLEYSFAGYQDAGEVTWQVLVDSEAEIDDPQRFNNTRSGTMTIDGPVQ